MASSELGQPPHIIPEGEKQFFNFKADNGKEYRLFHGNEEGVVFNTLEHNFTMDSPVVRNDRTTFNAILRGGINHNNTRWMLKKTIPIPADTKLPAADDDGFNPSPMGVTGPNDGQAMAQGWFNSNEFFDVLNIAGISEKKKDEMTDMEFDSMIVGALEKMDAKTFGGKRRKKHKKMRKKTCKKTCKKKCNTHHKKTKSRRRKSRKRKSKTKSRKKRR